MKVSDNDPSLRAGNNNGLKTISLLAAVSALAAILAGTALIRAAADDGLALAIIYHPSGSMNEAVLDSQLPHKHVLVITDGINTAGPSPASVLPKLKHQAQDKLTSLSVHFVAFDVDAKVFDTVKRQGATVVGAANENQLNTQLL